MKVDGSNPAYPSILDEDISLAAGDLEASDKIPLKDNISDRRILQERSIIPDEDLERMG